MCVCCRCRGSVGSLLGVCEYLLDFARWPEGRRHAYMDASRLGGQRAARVCVPGKHKPAIRTSFSLAN